MQPAAFFLALSDADSPMLLWLIVGGLMALGPVVHSYIKVYEWFKGKSIDTSSFVTRAEFLQAKAERDQQLQATVTRIEADCDKLERAMFEMAREFSSLHRSLGRVEGHDEAETKRRPR